MHWAGMKWTGTWSAGDLGRLFNSHYWLSKRQPTQLRQAHCRYDRPKVISRQRIVEILTARRRAGDDVVVWWPTAPVTRRTTSSQYPPPQLYLSSLPRPSLYLFLREREIGQKVDAILLMPSALFVMSETVRFVDVSRCRRYYVG